LNIPVGSCKDGLEQNKIESNEDPMLVFYSHFDEDYKKTADHYMNTHPESNQQITLKQLAVNLDHTIRFILTPELVGEILIADSTPTGGDEGKFIHSKVYMSASRVTERVVQTISIGTESVNDKYGSLSHYVGVGLNPSQNQMTIESNHDSIISTENLVVTINTQYTGATPTSFFMHFGPSYPTGISMRYTNTLSVVVTSTNNENLKEITVVAEHNNPLGDDNMDHDSTVIKWTGPFAPNSINHEDKSFTWVWDYLDDDAKAGDYTVEITVTDLQGHSASNSASFKIQEYEQDDDDSPSRSSDGFNYTFLLLLFGILIIIIIIIIIWIRKRKSKPK
jgi:hypothetical protein